jgi:hypothetical protein
MRVIAKSYHLIQVELFQVLVLQLLVEIQETHARSNIKGLEDIELYEGHQTTHVGLDIGGHQDVKHGQMQNHLKGPQVGDEVLDTSP